MKEDYILNTLESIRLKLLASQSTVSVAESVTSGHLQVAFSQAKEASAFFQGGITAYNAGQKTRHLSIEPICALKTNCVDQQVADQMAIHANTLFLSDYAIGITGYAATMPEKNVTELYAFLAIAHGGNIVKQIKLKGDTAKDSYDVQLDYTREALLHLDSILSIE